MKEPEHLKGRAQREQEGRIYLCWVITIVVVLVTIIGVGYSASLQEKDNAPYGL